MSKYTFIYTGYIRVSFGPLVHVSTKLVGLSSIWLLSIYEFVLRLFYID
jgi:hypothetical protein